MTSDAQSEAEELLQPLDDDQCRRLLGSVQFGRVAVVEGGRPLIVVLNHVVDGNDVLFRTRADARLARLTDGRIVHASFEVDSALPLGASGWSVIAVGHLAREHDEERQARARSTIKAWAEGDRDVVLRLEVHEVTGRSVGPI
jgi:nitroimidazol reductase NimA-like FMN-containing flavoprotein (pyridoxamine 5'-phosphate oxidase superfamily)